MMESKPNFKDEEYSLSNKGMMAFSLVISFDFMVTFITIYYYWIYVSDNQQRLYGLIFSLYALGSMLASPVFARWGQKRSIKEAVIICLIVDIVGNILYFLAFNWPGYTGEIMFAVGRLIAGFGGGGIVLSMNYLTSLSGKEERIDSMNKFRSWIFWGKFFAPVVAIFFLYTDTKVAFNEISFNSFTYPPLCTAILCVIALLIVIITVKNPRSFASHLSQEKLSLRDDPEAKQMLFDALKLSVIFVISLFSLWVIYAQIMSIGVFLFQIGEDNFQDIWYIYMPILAGAIASLLIIKVIPKSFGNEMLLLISAIGITLSLLTFVQFKSKESPYIYYIGCTFLFFFNGIFATAFRTLYSQVVGGSRHSDMMNSLLFVLTSIGQIVGPIVSGLFITIQPISDTTTHCMDPALCEIRGLNIAIAFVFVSMTISIIYTALLLFKFKLPSMHKDNQLEEGVAIIN